MLAIIVPAHNEEDLIEACLVSLNIAARHPALNQEEVMIVAVLDSCTDASPQIAKRWATHTIEIDTRNVGLARRLGADLALAAGARWLAFTDADSVVARDWLLNQLAARADAVCGTVTVRDWSHHSALVRAQHVLSYHDREGHRHVHGANLGVSASAYRAAGGFPALTTSEDLALVQALQANGAAIAWSARPRVTTSARTCFKAPGGFGAALAGAERFLSGANTHNTWVGAA